MASRQQIESISRELARIAGLRLRPPRAGEQGASAAGLLHSLLPPEFFHWYKCPFHGTWLQPEFEPYPHWQCQAKDYCNKMHEMPSGRIASRVLCQGHKCIFAKPAKFRQQIEKRIFRVARFLEDHA